jgi:Na+/H+-translocating membrane pyrophosphatase
MNHPSDPSTLIIGCSLASLVWAYVNFNKIAQTKIEKLSVAEENTSLTRPVQTTERQLSLLKEVHEAISVGAEAFLAAEYGYCGVFCTIFAVIIFCLITWSQNASLGFLTTMVSNI